MAIFKTKIFARFPRRAKLSDVSLAEAIVRAENRLIDAELGGGNIKQRLARHGQGRSGGYRTLIAFRASDIAVFLFGFAKSERDNIEPDELRVLRLIASQWLDDPGKIEEDAAAGILIEVKDERDV